LSSAGSCQEFRGHSEHFVADHHVGVRRVVVAQGVSPGRCPPDESLVEVVELVEHADEEVDDLAVGLVLKTAVAERSEALGGVVHGLPPSRNTPDASLSMIAFAEAIWRSADVKPQFGWDSVAGFRLVGKVLVEAGLDVLLHRRTSTSGPVVISSSSTLSPLVSNSRRLTIIGLTSMP
jgi:hypothetical protein